MPNVFVGSVLENNQGSRFVVESINGRMKVAIRFLDRYEHKAVVSAGAIKNGSIKNPYHPNVLGVGFMGVGEYRSAIGGKRTPEYEAWKAMLQRAYCSDLHARNPAYVGCEVQPAWHNFQTFAKWLNDQPNWGKNGFELDKDVTQAGNKVYGPDFCELVPRRINLLRMIPSANNGLSPGVTRSPNGNFRASCRDGSTCVKLGTYKTDGAAFLAYKQFKEGVIKKAAEEYRDVISERLYQSLISFEVRP